MPTTTAEPTLRRYRTRVPKPDAQFFDMNDRQVLALFRERCEQVCLTEVRGEEVVLTFEAPDLYELAIIVRDLQDELQSEGFHYTPLAIDRPTLIRTRRKATTR